MSKLVTYLCCITFFTTALQSSDIYIHPHIGNDSFSCLIGSHACSTLKYVADKVNSSTRIVLANTIHRVNEIIHVSNMTNVSLTAMENTSHFTAARATVYCTTGSNGGLKFIRNINLKISGIVFENCGSLTQSTSRISLTAMAMFRVAVLIINSTNVDIELSVFDKSTGMGLALFDNRGQISILDSNFTKNSVPEEERDVYSGGGGLYIEHTYCTPGLLDCDYMNHPFSNDNVYSIVRCNFIDNYGSTPPKLSTAIFMNQEKTSSRRLGLGVGITLTLKGDSSNNSITISNCTFEKNTAGFGAAVDMNLQDSVHGNEIFFQHCSFVNNTSENGGGGIFIGILFFDSTIVNGNDIVFNNTNFIGNKANYGGGTHIASSRIEYNASVTNTLTFSQCKWYQNMATLGAAFLLSPEARTSLSDGQLPVPVFINCLFQGNEISSRDPMIDQAVGTLFISTFSVSFAALVQFIGNSGTAVSISTGSINLLENSTTEFIGNSGVRGGGVALREFASIRLYPGSRITFLGNNASEVGGAIYSAAQDEIDFFFSRSCFIHYVNVTVPAREWESQIEFIGNHAGPTSTNVSQPQNSFAWGSSVFIATILPCVRASDITGEASLNNSFPHDTNDTFTFEDDCQGILCGIATAAASLQIHPDQLDPKGLLKMSPGENRNLSLIARDDLNKMVSTVVVASVSPSEVASVDTASLYITDGIVTINGKLRSIFNLKLTTIGTRQISTTVNAEFIDCPPGFIYQEQKQRCVCSATTNTEHYLGITRCDSESFRSLLTKDYWAGCDNNTLLTALCPPGYCEYDGDNSNPFYTLPRTCEQLQDICRQSNRKGRLCGECVANYSIFFHSEHYNCKKCTLGYFGWLFYILSELLPVTAVFLTVILLNVHITAGLWNSIILYAQVIDFIRERTFQSYDLPDGVSVLTSIYSLIYGSFNLDFFKYEDRLSYCLWDGATVMDVLAFRYLTAAYAFVLILSLLLSFKCQCWDKCQRLWEKGQAVVGRSHHEDLVVHGISAFLVLSYAFTVKISFQLLSGTQLFGKGSVPVKQVVFLSGGIEYFGVNHLPYALPAVLVIILTTLPPIFLIIYPNGVQLVNLCLGEKNVEKLDQCCNKSSCSPFRNFFRISRFKPLFDSFQGCFKDKCRFFAGVFFLYRFLVSLIAAVATDVVTFHATLELLSVFMLAFHAFSLPYERQLYNYLDTFIFGNLAFVNGLSLYGVYNSPSSAGNQTLLLSIFQLILIYLPLFLIITLWALYGVTGCSKKARHHLRILNKHLPLFKESGESNDVEDEGNDRVAETPFDEDHLPHRMFDDDEEHDTEPGIRRGTTVQ